MQPKLYSGKRWLDVQVEKGSLASLTHTMLFYFEAIEDHLQNLIQLNTSKKKFIFLQYYKFYIQYHLILQVTFLINFIHMPLKRKCSTGNLITPNGSANASSMPLSTSISRSSCSRINLRN